MISGRPIFHRWLGKEEVMIFTITLQNIYNYLQSVNRTHSMCRKEENRKGGGDNIYNRSSIFLIIPASEKLGGSLLKKDYIYPMVYVPFESFD